MAEPSRSFCSSTSTHFYPAAEQFPKIIYIFACVVTVILSVSSSLGNTMILLALRKCQSLHSPSKALLCSLALTDLFVGLIVLPLFTAYYLMVILQIPRYYCVIAITYGRTSTFIGGVSLLTVATIAIDRYLAFHLRLGYRELVKLRRVLCILGLEWIATAVWSGSWFWNTLINGYLGTIGLISCTLITLLCYLCIYRGLRHQAAQIHQQANSSSLVVNFNVGQYRKTVNNMLWINGVFLGCYLPLLVSLFAILVTGLSNFTRFALHFSAIVTYLNSSLNPILYCWKIKELREKVMALFRVFYNFLSSDGQ